MTEPIEFPDAVAVVIEYLIDELAGVGDPVDVVSRVPTDRPARFVRISRTGGPRRTRVSDAAQISVEAWGPLEEDARDLAESCRALLFAMRGTTQQGVAVYRVSELGGPALLPDPTSDSPRYVFTHQVQLRGHAFAAGS